RARHRLARRGPGDLGARPELAPARCGGDHVIPVDLELAARQAAGRPVQVAMVGAGVTGRAVALTLLTPAPGIRLAAIANRTLRNAERAYAEGGAPACRRADGTQAVEAAIARGEFVVTEDAEAVCAAGNVDVIVEVTGTLEHAAR